MLNRSIASETIATVGFSKDIFRNDHPSNSKIGGLCLYYRDRLPIKHRMNLEHQHLQEVIIAEIIFAHKRIFFLTVYQSPTQTTEQFEGSINNLGITINRVQAERPNMIILTNEFKCQSSQWWPQEIENTEGHVLDELMEINNLCQLIK